MSRRHLRKRFAAFPAILAATLMIASTVLLAFAQSEAKKEVNNFVHPPGATTQPLGRLGHIEKRGRGPVNLILIPGLGFSWKVYESFMTRNADRYTMYAITAPGYGGTPPPPMPTDPDFSHRTWSENVENCIVRLITERKLEKPVIVGHFDHGEYHAIRIALDHPDKVGALVVIANAPNRYTPAPTDQTRPATLEERRQNVNQQRAGFFKTVPWERWSKGMYPPATYSRDAARGQELWDETNRVPVPTIIRYFMEYLTTDVTPELKNLKVPFLVVNPIRDDLREDLRPRVKARSQWTRLGSDINGITIEHLENSRAFVMDDQPDALDKTINQFLKEKRKI